MSDSNVLPEHPVLSSQNSLEHNLQRRYAQIGVLPPTAGSGLTNRYQQISVQRLSLVRTLQRRLLPSGVTLPYTATAFTYIGRSHTLGVEGKGQGQQQANSMVARQTGLRALPSHLSSVSGATVVTRQTTEAPNTNEIQPARLAGVSQAAGPSPIQMRSAGQDAARSSGTALVQRSLGITPENIQAGRDAISAPLPQTSDTTMAARQTTEAPETDKIPLAGLANTEETVGLAPVQRVAFEPDVASALETPLVYRETDGSTGNIEARPEVGRSRLLRSSTTTVVTRQTTETPDKDEIQPSRPASTHEVVGATPIQRQRAEQSVAGDLGTALVQRQMGVTTGNMQAGRGAVHARVPRISETTVVARAVTVAPQTDEIQPAKLALPQETVGTSPTQGLLAGHDVASDLGATLVQRQTNVTTGNIQVGLSAARARVPRISETTVVARKVTAALDTEVVQPSRPVGAYQAVGLAPVQRWPAEQGVAGDLGTTLVQRQGSAEEREQIRERIPVAARQLATQSEVSAMRALEAPIGHDPIGALATQGRLSTRSVAGDVGTALVQRYSARPPGLTSQRHFVTRASSNAVPVVNVQTSALNELAIDVGHQTSDDNPLPRFRQAYGSYQEQAPLSSLPMRAADQRVVTDDGSSKPLSAMAQRLSGSEDNIDSPTLGLKQREPFAHTQALEAGTPAHLPIVSVGLGVQSRAEDIGGGMRTSASQPANGQAMPLPRHTASIGARNEMPGTYGQAVYSPVASIPVQRALVALQGAEAPTNSASGASKIINEKSTADSSAANAENLDLEQLATQVYHIIEQRLVIERESLGL